jgi:hypothetical protein
MTKVGILTYHCTTNFGATLQAYALSQVVKGQGYDVEFIDYRPTQLMALFRKNLYFSGKLLFHRNFIANAIRAKKMREFLLSQMELSEKTYTNREELKTGNHQYDVVICGSDEIWNIQSPFTGFDPSYFFDFISHSNSRKVSYAASFGSTDSLGNYKEAVCQLLQQFHAIAVRDSNSVKLVSDCNLNATKVLDPTLLGDYSKIIKIPKVDKKYILVYGGLTKEESNYVKTVAANEGLEIISVGEPWKYAPKANYVGVGPGEWLGYFYGASYVFTNFFHGSIFSIIYKKPFTVFSRSDKSIKVVDLLTDLGIPERIVTADMLPKLDKKLNTNLNLNYTKLQEKIEASKDYLYKALSSQK